MGNVRIKERDGNAKRHLRPKQVFSLATVSRVLNDDPTSERKRRDQAIVFLEDCGEAGV